MFTENFFTTLINLEDGWEVQSIETDLGKAEIYIRIICLLQELVDDQTFPHNLFSSEQRFNVARLIISSN
jgi:hypothetical protein